MKIRRKEVKVEIPKEPKCFETTDRFMVDKLVGLGFKIKAIAGPFGGRNRKLYTFEETEEQIKEKLNG